MRHLILLSFMLAFSSFIAKSTHLKRVNNDCAENYIMVNEISASVKYFNEFIYGISEQRITLLTSNNREEINALIGGINSLEKLNNLTYSLFKDLSKDDIKKEKHGSYNKLLEEIKTCASSDHYIKLLVQLEDSIEPNNYEENWSKKGKSEWLKRTSK